MLDFPNDLRIDKNHDIGAMPVTLQRTIQPWSMALGGCSGGRFDTVNDVLMRSLASESHGIHQIFDSCWDGNGMGC
jgi:hypothetical protein